MSILLDENTGDSPTDAYGRMKKMNTMAYKTLNLLHKSMFDFVWNNKDFTPKQMIEAMGTDAITIFTVSSKLQELLMTVNPQGYTPLEPTAVVKMNADGSATVEE